MQVTTELVLGLMFLLTLFIVFSLKLKEKNRLALFKVLINLAIEDMGKPLPSFTVEALNQRYSIIKETIDHALGAAKLPEEKIKCNQLLKELNEWRIEQIQKIYKKRLNEILKEYRETADINRKLTLLFKARQIVSDGVLSDPPLKKIDTLILHLYVMKAHLLAKDKKEKERYDIYEKYITKVINSGIEDSVMDESKEFRELIKEFEVLHRKFKYKRLRSE